MNKWKQLPKEEMIPLRQHMLAVALKSIIKTSFGDDYFKTNKEILEFENSYDTVCLNFIFLTMCVNFFSLDTFYSIEAKC